MDDDDMNREPAQSDEAGHDTAGSPEPMAPGDEAPPGAPGAAEDICDECGGSGRVDGRECSACAGTGKVTRGLSGA